MPTAALKHMAKRAKITIDRAEHLWSKAKGIVADEYGIGEDDPSYWALVTGITKKMIGISEMITFKQYLSEAAVDLQPKYTKLDVSTAIKLLNTKCKNALWMLELDKPFYRGFASGPTGDFQLVDTSATERRSQNTSNYYTEIFDNHPDMKSFPKRSRSFIGSTSLAQARQFASNTDSIFSASNDNLYVMIPTDTAKIGSTGRADMWVTEIELFGELHPIASINRDFKRLGIIPTIDGIKEFSELVASGDQQVLTKLASAFALPHNPDFSKRSFFDQVMDAYAPAKTGFTAYTTANFPHEIPRASGYEIWVGGEVVLISMDMWGKLRDSIESRNRVAKDEDEDEDK